MLTNRCAQGKTSKTDEWGEGTDVQHAEWLTWLNMYCGRDSQGTWWKPHCLRNLGPGFHRQSQAIMCSVCTYKYNELHVCTCTSPLMYLNSPPYVQTPCIPTESANSVAHANFWKPNLLKLDWTLHCRIYSREHSAFSEGLVKWWHNIMSIVYCRFQTGTRFCYQLQQCQPWESLLNPMEPLQIYLSINGCRICPGVSSCHLSNSNFCLMSITDRHKVVNQQQHLGISPSAGLA